MAIDQVRPLGVRVVSLTDWRDYESLLTEREREKAGKIDGQILRARFVVSRGLRRAVLADCTARRAGDLEFHEDRGRKPRLSDGDGWDFNVSHAGDYVALVAGRGAAGIDIERIRPVREMEAIAGRYFHPAEAAAWRAVDPGLREEAFFVLWSAREASMKCVGWGLARGLAATWVDPAILTGSAVRARVGEMELKVQRLNAPQGYVLALAQAAE